MQPKPQQNQPKPQQPPLVKTSSTLIQPKPEVPLVPPRQPPKPNENTLLGGVNITKTDIEKNTRKKLICLMNDELKQLLKEKITEVQPMKHELRKYEMNYNKILQGAQNTKPCLSLKTCALTPDKRHDLKLKMNDSLLKMYMILQKLDRPVKHPTMIPVKKSVEPKIKTLLKYMPIIIKKLSFPSRVGVPAQTERTPPKIVKVKSYDKPKATKASRSKFLILSKSTKAGELKVTDEVVASTIKEAVKKYALSKKVDLFDTKKLTPKGHSEKPKLKRTKKVIITPAKRMTEKINSRRPISVYSVTKYIIHPKLENIAKKKGFQINDELDILLEEKYFVKKVQN